jgi:hypothetical protein
MFIELAKMMSKREAAAGVVTATRAASELARIQERGIGVLLNGVSDPIDGRLRS